MSVDRNIGNTSPLTWAGSFPVYASTVLAGVHALTMVATALAKFAGAELLIHALQFSSSAVCAHFAIWQFATYAFIHPPGLLFLIELYMLVVFGQEIEKFLGRRAFWRIYLTLLLLPPLVLTAASFAGVSSFLAGSGALHFGIFVAFATLYPTAQIFLGIQAKWVAICLVAVSVLQSLADRDSVGLMVLCLDCCAAVFLVRHLRGEKLFPDFRLILPSRAPTHLRVLERPDERGEPADSIDDILEKISRAGMRSLNSRERARLAEAREALLKKDRTR